MSDRALSQAQFGDTPASPDPIREPQYHTEVEYNTPLPYNRQTNSSAKQASVWRKPRNNLSYSTATSGATFQPYSGNE